MKLCFLADGRSPHTQNWIRYFLKKGHEVHLISSYPCSTEDMPVKSLHIVSLDFSAKIRASLFDKGGSSLTTHGSPFFSRLRGSRLWSVIARMRDYTVPAAINKKKWYVRSLVKQIQPDLVHAMRVTYEGVLAAFALENSTFPLILSVWGIDFTWQTQFSDKSRRMVERALGRADALHPDCYRDLRLAQELGFGSAKPALVVPGNGGVHTDIFHPGLRNKEFCTQWSIPEDAPVVINPRGVKPYIRTDIFFQAIPLVLSKKPQTIFLGAMMQGNAFAENWMARLGIGSATRLLPYVPHQEMAAFFHTADVTISPSDHDGTPNTLLESMACQSFPVAGNIESVREWIDDGVNGLLCDQSRPESVASAILHALDDTALRHSAGKRNWQLINDRAEYQKVMKRVEHFYDEAISQAQNRKIHK